MRDYDYISALFLSAIYVDMRLKTLLTARLSPRKNKWKDVHAQLGDLLGVNRRLSVCANLGLVSPAMVRNLKKLWAMRSEVAHESRVWQKLTNEDVRKIKRLCKAAMTFLEQTNG